MKFQIKKVKEEYGERYKKTKEIYDKIQDKLKSKNKSILPPNVLSFPIYLKYT